MIYIFNDINSIRYKKKHCKKVTYFYDLCGDKELTNCCDMNRKTNRLDITVTKLTMVPKMNKKFSY